MRFWDRLFLEYKVILKTRMFYILFFLLTILMIIEGLHYYRTTIPQLLDYRLKVFTESIIPHSQLVISERESILDILRPIHPSTALLNPIYMFSTIPIIPFIVIASILMGIEFTKKTIKVKLSIYSSMSIFVSKIATIMSMSFIFIIYAALINLFLSLLLWPKVNNEYNFFLAKFNLDFSFSLGISIKEILIFSILLSLIVSFYCMISMFITFYSQISPYGMIVCLLPIIRFDSLISNIITAPMDAYYSLLHYFIPRKRQGNYIIPNFQQMAGNGILFTCFIMLLILFAMVMIIRNKRKIIQ